MYMLYMYSFRLTRDMLCSRPRIAGGAEAAVEAAGAAASEASTATGMTETTEGQAGLLLEGDRAMLGAHTSSRKGATGDRMVAGVLGAAAVGGMRAVAVLLGVVVAGLEHTHVALAVAAAASIEILGTTGTPTVLIAAAAVSSLVSSSSSTPAGVLQAPAAMTLFPA